MGKKRRPKFVFQIKWGEVQYLETGSRYWLSECGKFKIVASEKYEDIVLPLEYKLWHLIYFKGSGVGWHLFDTVKGRSSVVNGVEMPKAASFKTALKKCELRKVEFGNREIE